MTEDEKRKHDIRMILLMGVAILPVVIYHIYKNKKTGGKITHARVEENIREKLTLRDFIKSEMQSVKNSFKKAWQWLKK